MHNRNVARVVREQIKQRMMVVVQTITIMHVHVALNYTQEV